MHMRDGDARSDRMPRGIASAVLRCGFAEAGTGPVWKRDQIG